MKLIALFLLIISVGIYFPINRRKISNYHSSKFVLDKKIPFVSIFVFIYVGAYLYWGGTVAYAYLMRPLADFFLVTIALITASLVSYLSFFVFPTLIDRPEIESSGIANKLVKFIYKNDNPTGAFPSGHVFYTIICSLFLIKWIPDFLIPIVIATMLVSSSTVFIKQHYVLDILGGILLGILSYFLAYIIYFRF